MCYHFAHGDTDVLSVNHGDAEISFHWTITIPASCQTTLKQETLISDDVDGLITVIEPVELAASTINRVLSYEWKIWDNGDVKRARTRTFSFGVRLTNGLAL